MSILLTTNAQIETNLLLLPFRTTTKDFVKAQAGRASQNAEYGIFFFVHNIDRLVVPPGNTTYKRSFHT